MLDVLNSACPLGLKNDTTITSYLVRGVFNPLPTDGGSSIVGVARSGVYQVVTVDKTSGLSVAFPSTKVVAGDDTCKGCNVSIAGSSTVVLVRELTLDSVWVSGQPVMIRPGSNSMGPVGHL